MKYGLIHDRSVGDISKLCVNIFLPGLLFTNVGEHLSVNSLRNYIPVFSTSTVPYQNNDTCGIVVWALTYAFASIAVVMAVTKLLGLPEWITPKMAFNNSACC